MKLFSVNVLDFSKNIFNNWLNMVESISRLIFIISLIVAVGLRIRS